MQPFIVLASQESCWALALLLIWEANTSHELLKTAIQSLDMYEHRGCNCHDGKTVMAVVF